MSGRLDVAAAAALGVTRSKAADMIARGLVTVGGVAVTKPSFPAPDGADIAADLSGEYVGRGGLKLAAALDYFRIDLTGAVCLDVGASTGGFTDCMLRRGASSVLAVDNGRGQLAVSLAADPRVTNMEGVNITGLSPRDMPEGLSFAAADVSFVSLASLMPSVAEFLPARCRFVFLVKPQFELSRGEVGRGVVRSEKARLRAVARVRSAAETRGLTVAGVIPSPITGGGGNIEYLIHGGRFG
ncbi:MAG: TlyA family RNA methyltransferase [Clostridiales bacterium]|nr:TlyA family RNA methyltransferase [Clostridiales bacterium]